jgi:hypothetical protein
MKESPYDIWLNSYPAKELLQTHSLSDTGIWRAYGEDPNCDLGGHHHQPLLGTFEGRLEDVARYVVGLPGWFQWGSGGRIESYDPRITKITSESLREREEKLSRREMLRRELEKRDDELD